MIPQELKYNESHEWVRQDGDIAIIGITDYAQSEIQDIVFVELPDVGAMVNHKTEFGVIESVKAAFDLYAPVSGEVIEVNESLLDTPEQVNESPYDEGWFLKIKMTDQSELDALLDADGYQIHIEGDDA